MSTKAPSQTVPLPIGGVFVKLVPPIKLVVGPTPSIRCPPLEPRLFALVSVLLLLAPLVLVGVPIPRALKVCPFPVQKYLIGWA